MVYRFRADYSAAFVANCEPLCGWDAAAIGAGSPPWGEVVHPDDRSWLVEAIAEASGKIGDHGSRTHDFEYRIVTRDGRVRWVRDHRTSHSRDGVFAGADGFIQDVTARHELIGELERQHVLLDETQRLGSIGGWRWDVEQQAMTWTAELYRIHGFEPDEIVPGSPEHIRRSLECYDPGVREDLLQAFEACVADGSPYDLELPFTAVDGSRKWVRTVARPVFREGRIVAVIGNLVDITAAHDATDALAAERQRLENVVEGADVGTWEWNVQTGEAVRNGRWAEIVGYTLDELAPMSLDTWLKLAHPEDLERSERALARHFSGLDDHYECEARMRHKDGHWVWVLDRGRVLTRTPDGRPLVMSGIHQDISPRKTAERERAAMAAFVASSNDIIVIKDLDRRVVATNMAFVRASGNRSVADMLGKTDAEIFGVPLETEPIRSYMLDDLRTQKLPRGEVLVREETVPFPDGSARHFLTRKFPIFDDEDNLLATGIVSTDISDRKRMEEDLRAAADRLRLSEDRYRSFFAYAGEGVIISDAQSTIVKANLAAARILGYADPAALVGLHASDLIHPDDLAARPLQPVLEQLAPDEVARFERRYRRADGSWIPVAVAINFIGDTDYNHVFFTDLTERKRLEQEKARAEEQYRQAQKVESIGRLAGGVAHDLNNLLTPVLGYSDLLLDELGDREHYREPLGHIVSAAERARDLVQQLLAFSRKQTFEYQTFDLNHVIRRFAGLLRRVIREDIFFEMDLAPGSLTVQADIRQLEQVVMNLAVNARDAMHDGGRLTLETGVETFAADALRERRVDLAAGTYVRLGMTDTGCGMDAETIKQIFEPFFTTKGELGTGLGLATVYGIVKQHGGDIRVDSTPGAGTSFRVYLPLAAAAASAEEAAAAAVDGGRPGTAGTILLVEDDDMVRQLGLTILRRLGCEVLKAADGPQALALLQERPPGTVDLLLTDVVMPGMSGLELYERARELHPGLAVLYMSGYSEHEFSPRGILDPGMRLLAKPFTVRSLTARVREALANAHGSHTDA